MLYGSETWQIKINNMTRPERNDKKMTEWMCNVRSEDRIPVEELQNGLQLKTIMKYLTRNNKSESSD